MSGRLPSCTATDVIRALERAGWRRKRGTLLGIIADAGLTVEKFTKLL